MYRLLTITLLFAFTAFLNAGDWPRFRGPSGSGMAKDCNPPTAWSDTENIAWKTALPGAGCSSPVIWADKIFLSCYSGIDRYDKENRKNTKKFKQSVVCIDSVNGRILWIREFKSHDKKGRSDVIRYHGYASSTPVVDAERVYAFFGTTGVFALDHAGKELWSFTGVGTGTGNWGTGASPVLAGGKLVIPAQIESRKLIVLDKETGKQVSELTDNGGMWEGFRWGYSTPVTTMIDGKTQLVLGIMNGFAGYDLQTGKELWSYYYQEKGKGHSYPCTSPILVDGIAYFSIANSHRASDTIALRLDGAEGIIEKGNKNLLWHTKHGSYVGSPVCNGKRIYFCFFGTKGTRKAHGFFCLDAANGKLIYREPENRGKHPSIVYASAFMAGNKIYYTSVRKGVYVVAAGDKFELLSHNLIAEDDSDFLASPVPLGNSALLLRSDKFLYCIRKD